MVYQPSKRTGRVKFRNVGNVYTPQPSNTINTLVKTVDSAIDTLGKSQFENAKLSAISQGEINAYGITKDGQIDLSLLDTSGIDVDAGAFNFMNNIQKNAAVQLYKDNLYSNVANDIIVKANSDADKLFAENNDNPSVIKNGITTFKNSLKFDSAPDDFKNYIDHHITQAYGSAISKATANQIRNTRIKNINGATTAFQNKNIHLNTSLSTYMTSKDEKVKNRITQDFNEGIIDLLKVTVANKGDTDNVMKSINNSVMNLAQTYFTKTVNDIASNQGEDAARLYLANLTDNLVKDPLYLKKELEKNGIVISDKVKDKIGTKFSLNSIFASTDNFLEMANTAFKIQKEKRNAEQNTKKTKDQLIYNAISEKIIKYEIAALSGKTLPALPTINDINSANFISNKASGYKVDLLNKLKAANFTKLNLDREGNNNENKKLEGQIKSLLIRYNAQTWESTREKTKQDFMKNYAMVNDTGILSTDVNEKVANMLDKNRYEIITEAKELLKDWEVDKTGFKGGLYQQVIEAEQKYLDGVAKSENAVKVAFANSVFEIADTSPSNMSVAPSKLKPIIDSAIAYAQSKGDLDQAYRLSQRLQKYNKQWRDAMSKANRYKAMKENIEGKNNKFDYDQKDLEGMFKYYQILPELENMDINDDSKINANSQVIASAVNKYGYIPPAFKDLMQNMFLTDNDKTYDRGKAILREVFKPYMSMQNADERVKFKYFLGNQLSDIGMNSGIIEYLLTSDIDRKGFQDVINGTKELKNSTRSLSALIPDGVTYEEHINNIIQNTELYGGMWKGLLRYFGFYDSSSTYKKGDQDRIDGMLNQFGLSNLGEVLVGNKQFMKIIYAEVKPEINKYVQSGLPMDNNKIVTEAVGSVIARHVNKLGITKEMKDGEEVYSLSYMPIEKYIINSAPGMPSNISESPDLVRNIAIDSVKTFLQLKYPDRMGDPQFFAEIDKGNFRFIYNYESGPNNPTYTVLMMNPEDASDEGIPIATDFTFDFKLSNLNASYKKATRDMNSWSKAAYRILPFLYKRETKHMIEDYLENDDINTFTNKFFRLANRIGIAIKDKPTFTIKEQKAWKDWLESWVPGY